MFSDISVDARHSGADVDSFHLGRYAGGSRVVLAFAEPRAWKGRSGFGPAARDALANTVPDADLIVLFGHPRLLPELPTDGPVLLAWHRQQLMQEAVGRWLRRRVGDA